MMDVIAILVHACSVSNNRRYCLLFVYDCTDGVINGKVIVFHIVTVMCLCHIYWLHNFALYPFLFKVTVFSLLSILSAFFVFLHQLCYDCTRKG